MPVHVTPAGPIEVLEWGDGPELLVLLHAAAAGPQSLTQLAALLERPGRRVVAPALNRYGATVMRDEADRVRAHSEVLRACLDLYPADRRALFGHSMGGLIGLLSSGFDRLLLYDPIVMACIPDATALLAWDRAIVAKADIAAFVTAWNGTPWEALPEHVRSRLTAAAPMLIADMKAVSYHDLPLDQFQRIQTPVLLLQGAQSPPITHAITGRLAKLLPNARRIVLDGCGHMGPVQVPAKVAPFVAEFATP